jgi:hypothetical protein
MAQLRDDLGRQLEKGPKLRGLLPIELRDMEDMTLRLDDERTERQRSDAVFHQPA